MNQESRDKMRPEYDMRGGARGKYFARYQRWKSITSAQGTATVSDATSASETPAAGITVMHSQVVIHYTSRIVGPRVAPEVATFAGHAG